MAETKMRITINPKILAGKPIINGTRVPIHAILGSLAAGMEYKEVIKEYGIEFEDILACLNYAVDVVSSEEAYTLAKGK
ncbi:hypothetical protein A2230_05795 [candidate division WOR-1 bacterium RIFOXYA2_FULL_36_21]|uniref:Antitoxin n=1 Tax=candidate division WOR-1 bacterium RIFOXYB2_FULL_36_35 TaxID=1802578 RepID=A0A1F4S8U5_UNCSA|nr:MAG: hypothetical protein A2230_05795 [candidate division WOR-1 bacterium RIFOXYA2_FULL_36_21]OGC16868.1 MAG: hypothetical protein A2290_05080 [candidate division WOR-1 bacterium RIFOXYB2_FULL_36_35]OGC18665.1 MAG: hypothetical protein A2282_07130 [candidate division WOR-1 bacterium RIFOXYA12_FULL_36_13]